MDRWSGKVAVVTGASSGIGASIVEHLVKEGLIVIGLARRQDRLREFGNKMIDKKGQFHSYHCDVTDLDSIKNAFSYIKEKFGRVHVLVNNAGIAKMGKILTEGNEKDLDLIMRTNFMGSVYCTKEMYTIMKNTGEDCHIININSILGYSIPKVPIQNINMYPSSKFALRAESEVIRQELDQEKNFRISSISPGLVKTEIVHTAGYEYADQLMSSDEILLPEDIAASVLFVLGTPRHVQVSELVIKPVGEKF